MAGSSRKVRSLWLRSGRFGFPPRRQDLICKGGLRCTARSPACNRGNVGREVVSEGACMQLGATDHVNFPTARCFLPWVVVALGDERVAAEANAALVGL